MRFRPGVERSLCRHLLALSEESRFLDFASESAVSDPPATDPLMIRSYELLGPCDFPSEFW